MGLVEQQAKETIFFMPPASQYQPSVTVQGQPVATTSMIQVPDGPTLTYGDEYQTPMQATGTGRPRTTAMTTSEPAQSRPLLQQEQSLLDLLKQVIRYDHGRKVSQTHLLINSIGVTFIIPMMLPYHVQPDNEKHSISPRPKLVNDFYL